VKKTLPGEGEVDLWWADLHREPGVPPDQCLSPEELARGARFVSAALRRRFLRGRTLLRLLLSSYLDQEPAALQFRTGRFGKPGLTGQRGWSSSVSHSEEWFVCAVSAHRRLGVDIEAVRELTDATAIAARFFSGRERDSLGNLAAADGRAAFFSCWTRKEALIKATGFGLTLPLDSFDVAVGFETGNCLLSARVPSLMRRNWHIVDATREGWPPCAVAADAPIDYVRHRELPLGPEIHEHVT
jgi:4'-phosphopantetheinyl transferase